MTLRQQQLIAYVAHHVAQSVLSGDDALNADQMAMVERITSQLIQEIDHFKTEQALQKEERDELITSIVLNVAKGIAIVIALLVLRAIIGSIGKGVRAESADTPMAVLDAPVLLLAVVLPRRAL